MRHAHIGADGTTTTWHDHDFAGPHNPAVGLDAAIEAFNTYLEYVRRHSLLDADAMGKFNDLTHDYWSRRLDKAAGVDYNGDDQIDEDKE